MVVFECPREWVMPLISLGFEVGREEAYFLFQNLFKMLLCFVSEGWVTN